MLGLDIPQTWQAIIALLILAGMFVMFLREVYPVEVVAIGGAVLMLILGILPMEDVPSVLSNNAPWTIAAMFIIVGALVRTGALESVTGLVSRSAEKDPRRTLGTLGIGVTGASAFLNNTPIVVVMMPVFVRLGKQLNLAASKLLIPLSYMTILGGTITLVGTSTNLVVDGVAAKKGLEHFGIFEMTPIGLIVAAVGLTYIALFAKRLLPERESMSALLSDRKGMKFFTEVAIPEESSLIGRKVQEVELFKRGGARVIDVLRGDASLRRGDMAAVVLEAGDRVVLRTAMAEVLGLKGNKDLDMREVDKLSSIQTATVEVLISPGCRMIGRTLGEMRLRRRYGVYVLAAHRRSMNIGRQLDELVVQVGDTLLLEGRAEDIKRLAEDMAMVDVSHPKTRAYRRAKAPIAIGALAMVVILSSLDVAPILPLAFVAVVVILLTGCVDADEAFDFVDGRLMAMIFAMLAVGEGLDRSGAVGLIVAEVKPFMEHMSPFAMILSIYLLGLVMTEFLSNNAVAVIFTPIAIELAHQLGVDPRPFVVAVMFSATLAFGTPVGYQTNMMVYGPGGYKFLDFTKVGIPLNIITWLLCSALIPVLWPLHP